MIVSTVCPSCGHKYDVASKLAGRKVRCNECSTIFRVPVPVHNTSPRKRSRRDVLSPQFPILDEVAENDALHLEVPEIVGGLSPSTGLVRSRLPQGLTLLTLALLLVAYLLGYAEPRWLASVACLVIGGCLLSMRLAWGEVPARSSASRVSAIGGFLAVACLMLGILIAMDVIHVPSQEPLRAVSPSETEAAASRSRQEALRLAHPGKAVTIEVRGFPEEAEAVGKPEEILTERIRGLAPDAEMAVSGAGTERSYTLAPIDDPERILRSIDFGQAGRRGVLIDVDLSPAFLASLAEAVQEAPLIAGSDEIEAAVRDLKSTDRTRQKDAASRLVQIPRDNARRRTVVAALVPLLDSGDDATAMETVKALLSWQTPEAITVLIDQLKDPRAKIRQVILDGLARTADTRALEAVVARVKEEPQAVGAALKLAGTAAEPVIFPRLLDPDPSQRAKACDLLADLGGTASVAALQPALSDRDEVVRLRAALALEAIHARIAAAMSR